MTKPTDPQLDALSRRIAEHMGLNFEGVPPGRASYGFDPEGEPVLFPDYARSLDSMHEAEKALFEDESRIFYGRDTNRQYALALCYIATNGAETFSGSQRCPSVDMYDFAWMCSPEAWQRAIALDRALSKEPLM